MVINPVAVAPVFAAVTNGMGAAGRRSVLNRALVIAFCVALFFLLAGRLLLSHLGVTMHAFAVSGGLLLFLLALPMRFGQRSSLQSPDGAEHGTAGEDVAIFPMAIPCWPGRAPSPRCWCWRRRPGATCGGWPRSPPRSPAST